MEEDTSNTVDALMQLSTDELIDRLNRCLDRLVESQKDRDTSGPPPTDPDSGSPPDESASLPAEPAPAEKPESVAS